MLPIFLECKGYYLSGLRQKVTGRQLPVKRSMLHLVWEDVCMEVFYSQSVHCQSIYIWATRSSHWVMKMSPRQASISSSLETESSRTCPRWKTPEWITVPWICLVWSAHAACFHTICPSLNYWPRKDSIDLSNSQRNIQINCNKVNEIVLFCKKATCVMIYKAVYLGITLEMHTLMTAVLRPKDHLSGA